MSDGDRILIPSRDPRLGRHVNHDGRSRAFAVPLGVVPTSSKRHRRYGTKLNQGMLGACTGFAGAHALNTDPVRAARRTMVVPLDRLMRDADGVSFYSEATTVDPFPGAYPPVDTGSDGLTVCKVMRARGYIASYEWAFGFQSGLGVISQYPLMQGSDWTDAMFAPDLDGRVHPDGAVAGGHEYLWIGVEIRSKVTLSRNRSWFLNSWGDGFGVSGYFYLTWADHEALLARNGDLGRPVS